MPSPSLDSSKRLPVPTRALLGLAAAFLVLAGAIPLVPGLSVVWTAAGALVLVLIGVDVSARPPRGGVTVRRILAPVYHVGRRAEYDLVLENTTQRTLSVEIQEVSPPKLEGQGLRERALLEPGECVTRTLEFVSLNRGIHRLLPVGVRVAHPMGLIAYQRYDDLRDHATVVPGRPAGETQWLLSQASVIEELGQRRVRRRGAEREFESLREYVVGDELRRIDWKASARRFKPMVRQYESERNSEVILAIDCGRLMGTLVAGIPKLDMALTPVLDLAAVALKRGERVGFLAFDSQVRAFIPPRAGMSQLKAIQHSTGPLPSGADPTSYLRAVRYLEAHHRKRCLLVVFTDFTDELSARDMYASLTALTRRHVLIFVGVGDPQLEEIFRNEDGDARSVFQAAVAGQLLGERRRVLANMERLGIFTVDGEPNRLSGPLIRRFLEVRLRGVL